LPTTLQKLIDSVQVGALPDMLTLPQMAITCWFANEGKPSDDYRHDPEGSVGIIKG